MNLVKKTLSTIAATAAIVAGIVGVNHITEKQIVKREAKEFIDDVAPITVETPTVKIPQVTAVNVNVPEVSLVRIISKLEIEELGIPDVELSNVLILESPGEKVDIPEFSELKIDQPNAKALKVKSYTERIPDWIKLQKIQMKLFKDQRNLMYDKTIGLDSKIWKEWIKIYKMSEYQTYEMEYVPLEKNLRIINEVKCPRDIKEFQQLQKNLEYYIKRGYNSVLVTFTTDEELFKLKDTIEYLKSLELKIIIAYSGIENLNESIFKDPNKLSTFLSELGEISDALLLGWGRTSLHLFLPDKQWTNFLVKNARRKNSKLAIIGMAYFGETSEKLLGVSYDVPKNCSAVLVVGLGFPKSSTRTALKKLFPEIIGHPHKIGLVAGEIPYFDSLHDTGKSKRENDQIKRRIEIRLIKAGFESTMTYSGDGSDGQYGRKDRTENLCLPYGK